MIDHKFRAVFGVPVAILETVERIVRKNNKRLQKKHLHWAIFFLKNYQTEDSGVALFGLTKKLEKAMLARYRTICNSEEHKWKFYSIIN